MRPWSIVPVVMILFAAVTSRAEHLPALVPSSALPLAGETATAVAPSGQGIVATSAPAVVPGYFAPSPFTAFDIAVKTDKPMVVVFWQSAAEPSVRLFKEVLATNAFRGRYEPRAVFVAVDPLEPDARGNNDHLARSLGITQVPIVCVIDAYADRLAERARITGYLPYDKFITEFEKVLRMPKAEQK